MVALRFLLFAFQPTRSVPDWESWRQVTATLLIVAGASGTAGWIGGLEVSDWSPIRFALVLSVLLGGLFLIAGVKLQYRREQLEAEPGPNIVFTKDAPAENNIVTYTFPNY
ncbi:MAG: hypothetical protein ACSLFM_07455, partial [Tepidiformaceae bacterium]